jgi:hypothetical protein
MSRLSTLFDTVKPASLPRRLPTTAGDIARSFAHFVAQARAEDQINEEQAAALEMLALLVFMDSRLGPFVERRTCRLEAALARLERRAMGALETHQGTKHVRTSNSTPDKP